MCKKCTVCQTTKELDDFRKDYRYNPFKYTAACKKCIGLRQKIYKKSDNYKQQERAYRERMKDKTKEYSRKRRESGVAREYYVNYKKERKKKDPLFKLSELLRGNTYHAFKRMGYKKQTKTQKILGADFETVKKHIESQFLKGMTWENRSDNVWHIDHIIPISFAKTEEELLKLCSYNNLQPLWAKENIVKGGCVPVLSKLY